MGFLTVPTLHQGGMEVRALEQETGFHREAHSNDTHTPYSEPFFSPDGDHVTRSHSAVGLFSRSVGMYRRVKSRNFLVAPKQLAIISATCST